MFARQLPSTKEETMNIGNRLVPLAVVALLVAGAATAAFAVGGDSRPPQDSEAAPIDSLGEEPVSGQPPVRSDEGIDPNECSLVHNIDACDAPVASDGSAPPAVPPGVGDEPSGGGGQPPITSIDDIDPNECNLVHNIEACGNCERIYDDLIACTEPGFNPPEACS